MMLSQKLNSWEESTRSFPVELYECIYLFICCRRTTSVSANSKTWISCCKIHFFCSVIYLQGGRINPSHDRRCPQLMFLTGGLNPQVSHQASICHVLLDMPPCLRLLILVCPPQLAQEAAIYQSDTSFFRSVHPSSGTLMDGS